MNKKNLPELIFKSIVIVSLVLLVFMQFRNNGLRQLAYVDAVKLMNKYKGMEKAREELDLKSAAWKANLDTLKNELERSIRDFNSSKNKTQFQEELIRKKEEDLRRYSQLVDEQYRKSEKELLDHMLLKVNDKIKAYALEKDYSIILSGTQLGTIAYADDAYDITDELIGAINHEYDSGK